MTSRILICGALTSAFLFAGCGRSLSTAPDRGGPAVVADVVAGLGSVSCTQAMDPGQGASCTVTAQDGFALTGLTDNGVSVIGALTGDHYDIAQVTTDHAVAASFSKMTANAARAASGSNADGASGRRVPPQRG